MAPNLRPVKEALKSILPGPVRAAIRKVIPTRDYVRVSGSIIPSPDLRFCGSALPDDDFYLRSAESEADRLVRCFQCDNKSRVFDVGCGQGRLPIGILRKIGKLNYMGMDVHRKSIDWCRRHIEHNHPSFVFKYIDVLNERYNADGMKIHSQFRFDLEPQSMDVVYLYSVFSHMIEADMRVYLNDFLRILDGNGKVFFTTFVEEGVPDVTINPENYRLKCAGALHIVRYNKDYLFSVLDECGYSLLDFSHATELDGQSAIYLSKKRG
jgi:SAM-dependent methyltransferase